MCTASTPCCSRPASALNGVDGSPPPSLPSSTPSSSGCAGNAGRPIASGPADGAQLLRRDAAALGRWADHRARGSFPTKGCGKGRAPGSEAARQAWRTFVSCARSARRWSTGPAPCSRPGGREGPPSLTVTAVPARAAPPTIGGRASRARSVRWLPSSRLASAASSGHRAPPTSATCGRFPTGPRKQQPQLRSSGCRPRGAFASCRQSAVAGRAAGVPCGPCGCSGVPVRCASGFAGSCGCARWLAWSLVPTSPVCVPCATATPAAVAALAAAPAAWLHGFRCRRHALRHRHIRCLRSFARVVARAPVARVRASRVRASRCPPQPYSPPPGPAVTTVSPPPPPPRLSRLHRHRLASVASVATVSPPSPPSRRRRRRPAWLRCLFRRRAIPPADAFACVS